MTPPQFAKRPCRPRDQLADAGHDFPGAWGLADHIRAGRGTGLDQWPAWCYLPMGGWYAIASRGSPRRLGLAGIADVSRLAALGAWRLTQGIYRFDADLYAAIRDTPVESDIPHEILYRMPEWCVYIETPGMTAGEHTMYGFFAHLEWDDATRSPELRLLLDLDDGLTPLPLHLGPWSLGESIDRVFAASSKNGFPGTDPTLRDFFRAAAGPAVSLLLYLCSENSEIGSGERKPANPEPKRTKRGWKMFQAERVTTWDVGVRLGSALRRAYQAAESAGDGTHAGPRGHVRRAHWHGFRSGPMKTPAGEAIPAESRRFDLRWLPPIPVNLDSPDALPATIHPVKKS